MQGLEPTARLDAAARVVLVSDLHLGDGGPTDPFAKKDDRFRAFLDDVASRADALVIAGDGFDLAQAWTMDRIYDRHRRVVDDLAALSRSVPVHYLRGNHEGSARDVARALPVHFSLNLRIGDRVVVEHGNVFDPYNEPDDRGAFLASRVHALIERAIRSPVRIPMRKHYCWSTRLGHWLFYRYGQLQRLRAALHRALGQDARSRACLDFLDYWGRGEWGDAQGLVRAAEIVLMDPEVDVLVCGHSHQPGRVRLGRGTYVNTGSWTFDESTYALYEDGRFVVRSWPDGRAIEDEEYRGILGPHKDKSFFDWWDAYYEGWLRYDLASMERDAAQGASS